MPNPGSENDIMVAQAVRKLTFYTSSSTIQPVVPRRNNRASKRGVAPKQDDVVKPEEMPKWVGDPKDKKKPLPQTQWQDRQVTQAGTYKANEIVSNSMDQSTNVSTTTQLEQPTRETTDTRKVAKESAVQMVEKQLSSLLFIEDSTGLKGPEQHLLSPT
ncbi:hypothetical protein K7X08_025714 [Anisodus acutangulus]|uniref:Uncharacterized protein n=1 Tax=Anisodus acutangulus TaxID=402998 RepID=A0A9Q1QXY0_9SOLA|nr:hypothetical protein K7X08_025714 [Anisodus acutangulus]